jgi:GxxExxY protein
VIGCAIEVHRALGPGLLESAYEQCLAPELAQNGIRFQLQHPQPVDYKGIHLDCGYRIDLLVEDVLILELKSVDKLTAIHEAQLLTYMKLAGLKTGPADQLQRDQAQRWDQTICPLIVSSSCSSSPSWFNRPPWATDTV